MTEKGHLSGVPRKLEARAKVEPRSPIIQASRPRGLQPSAEAPYITARAPDGDFLPRHRSRAPQEPRIPRLQPLGTWFPGSSQAHRVPHNAPHHLREASCGFQTVLRKVPRPSSAWYNSFPGRALEACPARIRLHLLARKA